MMFSILDKTQQKSKEQNKASCQQRITTIAALYSADTTAQA